MSTSRITPAVSISDPRVAAARGARSDGFPTAVVADQYASPIGPRNDIGTRLQAHIERFIAFNNPHHSRVLALWVLHTWVFDAFRLTPYIYVSSVDPGAGKTTLMEVVEGVARNAKLIGSTTAAGLYRQLIDQTPTFILDELDTTYNGAKNDDLRNALNTGYKSNGVATRFINGESTDFPTYCPKFLGGIDNGQVPATVMDRCIRIRLRKVDSDTLHSLGIEEYDFEELEESGTLEDFQKMLSEWGAIDTAQAVKETEVERIEGLSARQWQLIRPLLRIAKFLGTEDEARTSLEAIFQGEKNETPEMVCLRKLRDLFNERGADKIAALEMAEVTGYSVGRMGRILGGFGLKSQTMKIAGETVRGYFRVEVIEVADRILG